MKMSLKKRVADFLQRAAEYEKRATRVSDVEMQNVLRELGKQYRRLAAQVADDPYCTRRAGESRPSQSKGSRTRR